VSHSLVFQQVIRYQLPTFLWAAIIFVSSSIPSARLPHLTVFGIDKLVHFGIFFVLCLLVHRGFRHQSRFPVLARYGLALSILATMLYGVSDELHQSFVPGRNPNVFDVIADGVGGLLYAFSYRMWYRWKS